MAKPGTTMGEMVTSLINHYYCSLRRGCRCGCCSGPPPLQSINYHRKFDRLSATLLHCRIHFAAAVALIVSALPVEIGGIVLRILRSVAISYEQAVSWLVKLDR
ncbi:uncharacterized protein [Physcomitrium patens]|uniref:uncharacterized protein isoform X1 n=1 Tax=Physcomitrium patens TaxID=3218 RepID=UPI003CCE53BA